MQVDERMRMVDGITRWCQVRFRGVLFGDVWSGDSVGGYGRGGDIGVSAVSNNIVLENCMASVLTVVPRIPRYIHGIRFKLK